MNIPRELPQFNETQALIIATGEIEAVFYSARNGIIEKINEISFDPREDAKEKQAFVSSTPGGESLGATSHVDSYMEDLKRKFIKELGEEIKNKESNLKAEKIYIFSPKYFEKKFFENLPRKISDKIEERFSGEYTKISALELLKMIKEKNESKSSTEHIHQTVEEKKIIHKLNDY